jgi:outer membrane lipoprotein-sorting protein
MTSSLLRLFPAACTALVFATAGHAAEPAIVAKARAFVGTEAALNGVTSIHYSGTLITADPTDPKKQASAAIEIFFQKPDQQRIQAIGPKIVEVTALDGYDAWQRQHEVGDPTKWQQTLLGPDQIKRLRANTWENLSFFRGLEAHGGRVEEKGSASFDGVDCAKIAFIHAPNIIFNRYFDKATGRLVFTETEAGGTIRENGEMRVNGVRFPKTIITTTKNATTGQTQTVTITFDKIVLNEPFPAKLFAPPALLSK